MAVTRLNAPVTVNSYDLTAALQAGLDINFNTYGMALARLDDDNLVAVWTYEIEDFFTDELLHSEIGTRLLNADGSGAALADTYVDPTSSVYFGLPTVVSQDDGSYFISYGIDVEGDSDLGLIAESYLAVYNNSGTLLFENQLGSTVPGADPTGEFFATAVRLADGNTLVMWSDTHGTTALNYDNQVLGQVYDEDGMAVGNSFDVSAAASGYQLPLGSSLLADGRAVVVYNAGTISKDVFSGVVSGAKETALKARLLSATGVPTGAEITIDTTPANAAHSEVEILNIGTGGWVAIWIIENANGTESIQAQRFSITGTKVGTKVTIATTEPFDEFQTFATVELANGGYAVVWEEFDSNFDLQSAIRYFDMNGVVLDANDGAAGTDLTFGGITGFGGGIGMDRLTDLELAADGTVVALGVTETRDDNGTPFDDSDDTGTGTIQTVQFDTGLPTSGGRVVVDGTIAANTLYGKNGFNDFIRGLEGNDKLFGLSGDDWLDGGSGNDILNGGTGNDQMTGGDGNDTYVVDSAIDEVIEFNDASQIDTVQSYIDLSLQDALIGNGMWVENLTLLGNAAFVGTGNFALNVIIGNDLSNTLDGGGADNNIDQLKGGKGDDIYILYEETNIEGDPTNGDTIVELSKEGTDTVYTEAANHTLASNVEVLRFTSSIAHTGTGTGGNDTLVGNSEADVLKGLGGNDILDGSDFELGDDGKVDTLEGGLGNDTYYLFATVDNVIDTGGIDTINTDQTTFSLAAYAQIENLTYRGGPGAISLTGNALANVIDSGNGSSGTLIGELGNDTYVLRAAGIIIDEEGGEGTADKVQTYVDIASLWDDVENVDMMGAGNLSVEGNDLANKITGNSGNNTLDGGNDLRVDTLIGGAGNDTYILRAENDIVVDTITEASGAAGGIDTVESRLNAYTLAGNVENLVLYGSSNVLKGTGNGLANIITGNSHDNTLDGGAGNDILIGGGGNDKLIGGAGNDAVSFAGLANGVTISLLDTGPLSDANGGFVTLTTIEDIIGTGSADDLRGNALANRLTGADGNDKLYGEAGNDTLLGGAGNDVLDGGAGDDRLDGGGKGASLTDDELFGGVGNDTYVIRDGTEVVVEGLGGGIADKVETDLASFSLTTAGFENIENLTLTKAGGAIGTGNLLANVVTGTASDDVLDGGQEVSILAAVVDKLIGGAGNDKYYVRDVKDSITESSTGGTADEVIIDETKTTLTSYTLTAANVEKLSYVGSSGFSATGSAGNNIITTSSGNDTLNGGAGNDVLIGGAGDDTLIGGTGNDTAVFNRTIDDGNGYSLELKANGDVVVDSEGTTIDDGADTLRGIEFVEFAGGDVYRLITGTTANNVLTGTTGNDIIIGGAGNDTITGGYGNDALSADGGASHEGIVGAGTADVLDYSKDVFGVEVDMQFFSATEGGAIGFGIGEDFFEDFENVNGGSGHDFILGDAQNNVLNGNGDEDFLAGRGGDDTIIGGAGNFDTAAFKGSFFFSGNGYSISLLDNGSVEVDSDGADTFEGKDTLTGIEVLAFDDFFTTGLDSDGFEAEFYRLITGNTSANTLSTDDFDGYDASIILAGKGNDTINGNDQFNIMSGGDGNDTLNGTANGFGGFDFFVGGAGNDILNANAAEGEADFFYFTTGFGLDTINGFEDGVDLIDVREVAGYTGFASLKVTDNGSSWTIAVGGDTANVITVQGAGITITADDFIPIA